MIKISQSLINPSSLLNQLHWNDVEREIIERLARSQAVFNYDSNHQLNFEVRLRNQIVKAARDLYYSGVSFATFDKSRCNEKYWNLTQLGGFKLREGVQPYDAIQDIFHNGSEYAFECATAIVIVYYRAVLKSIDTEFFNRLFSDILLYDWKYDADLGLINAKDMEKIPGDVLYFKNPDFNPGTPEWQGENAVFMGNGKYYGHGIGITGAEEMIRFLNKKRKPGASRSAYLTDEAIRPDFKYLARYSIDPVPRLSNIHQGGKERIVVQIGSSYFEL